MFEKLKPSFAPISRKKPGLKLLKIKANMSWFNWEECGEEGKNKDFFTSLASDWIKMDGSNFFFTTCEIDNLSAKGSLK